jgi:hydroxymethylglutaryl-CoA lyase
MGIALPESVSIVEVGPRDGLQNESARLSVSDKVRLVEDLAAAGLRYIETGSFVNPRRIPQMADSEAVFEQLRREAGVIYAALTPNLRGFERARAVRASEVAVFAAASESFSRRNINCGIAESLERFRPVLDAAAAAGVPVRGYVSCVLGCPYEGRVTSRPRPCCDVSEQSAGTGLLRGVPGRHDRRRHRRAAWRRPSLATLLSEAARNEPAWPCTATTPTGRPWRTFSIGLQHGIAAHRQRRGGAGRLPLRAKGPAGNVASGGRGVHVWQGLGLEYGRSTWMPSSPSGQRCCETARAASTCRAVAQARRRGRDAPASKRT